MIKKIDQQTKRFAEDLGLLRDAQGNRLSIETYAAIGRLIDDPGSQWETLRTLPIAVDVTFEKAVALVNTEWDPATVPSADDIVAAIEYAAR